MKRMPQTKQSSMTPTNNVATVGYEARLWHMADTLRESMDAAEDTHVMLDLCFLTDISDAFEATDGGVFAGAGGDT
jgi:type I restriction enzyme M protein